MMGTVLGRTNESAVFVVPRHDNPSYTCIVSKEPRLISGCCGESRAQFSPEQPKSGAAFCCCGGNDMDETYRTFWNNLSETKREYLRMLAAKREERRANAGWRKRLQALVKVLYQERGACCEACNAPTPLDLLRPHYRDYAKAQRHETADDICLLCRECYQALHKRITLGKLTDDDARFLPPGTIILYGRIARPRKRKEKGHVEKDRVGAYRREQIKKIAAQIEGEKGIVTSVDLASAMNIASLTARSYINWLVTECGWVETSAAARCGAHRGGGRRSLAAKKK